MLHNTSKVRNRGRIIKISLLRGLGKSEVMIDQQNKRLPLLGRQLQTRGDTLGEERARFGMRPGANRLTAVVQKKRKIKNKRILKLLKDLAVSAQLRVGRLRQGIKFIDAYQCVLISRVTVEKLMLHQTSKLAEFGNVSAQKIDPMHHSEDTTYLPFL